MSYFQHLAIGLLAVSGVAAHAEDRRFTVTGFDHIMASGSENITITTGKAASLVATGAAEQLDKLDINVEGNTLRIDHKSHWGWNWGNRDAVRIAITMPALQGIKASGSGDIVADHGTGPMFESRLSGSGNLRIADIDSSDVVLGITGSGDITAAGKCKQARLTISGSGEMALAGLTCSAVDIGISGSGDVVVRATQEAMTRVSGSGNVVITGGARCQSRTTGRGTISCH